MLNKLFVVAALSATFLCGCTGMSWSDAGNIALGVGEVAVGAVALDVELHEPPIEDRDVHMTWCHDHRDHQHCK